MVTDKDLISSALTWLDEQEIVDSLCGTARALTQFYDDASQRSLRDILEKDLVHLGRLTAWSLPDAVWAAICCREPRLYCYPLGEIAERAVKKSIAELALRAATDSVPQARPDLGEREIEENLRHSLGELGQEGRLRHFLSHYFFEVCIDARRRPSSDPSSALASDWSYNYHFSEDGRMHSLAVEWELRKTLGNQCAASAQEFLPFLVQECEENKLIVVEQHIGDGFHKVFDVSLRRSRKKRDQDSGKPFVNVVVGNRSLGSIKRYYTLDKKFKRFLLHTDRPNVAFSFARLEKWLGHPLHSLTKDLLDVGVSVYMSDIYTRRKHNLSRRLGLLVPVRHHGLWPDARTVIARTIASLGRDDASIQFSKRRGEQVKKTRFSIKDDERCVCLFSGGLDSIAGAVWAFESGRSPVFVSHYASAQLAHIQDSLIRQLEDIYDQVPSFRITQKCLTNLKKEEDNIRKKLWELRDQRFLKAEFLDILEETLDYKAAILLHAQEVLRIGLYVAKSKSKLAQEPLRAPPPSIMTQHLRSFLFLSIAAAVALESRISTVYVFENGPVALNPLLSEARVNTRTAHPDFLAHFRALIKTVFKVDLRIENPFAYLTKGEVTSILAKSRIRDLVAQTNSCWNWTKVALRASKMEDAPEKCQATHDGDCLPCIVRRTSMHRAELWEQDAQYLVDIFAQYPPAKRDTHVAIADLVRFCQNVLALSDAELLLRMPDFSVYEDDTDPQSLVTMYREHAREVIRCFRARGNAEFQRRFAPLWEKET